MNAHNDGANDMDKLNNSSMALLSQGTLPGVKSDPSLGKNIMANYDPNFERDQKYNPYHTNQQ